MGNSSSIPTKHKYGWKKDKKDDRDHKRIFNLGRQLDVITKVDLRPSMPPVYDQGQLGSCTANSSGAAYQYDQIIQKEATNWTPSRLFIYYNSRKLEGTINEDSGAEIRDAIKSIADPGVCPEVPDWPYDISKFTECPPQSCYDTAQNHKAVQYQRIDQTLDQLKSALISGFPIVFGFAVYSSFESASVEKTGIVPMPNVKSETLLGGHSVICTSFDDSTQRFGCANSWGPNFGDKGYIYMPYEYLTNSDLADDFWIIQRISDTTNVNNNPDNADDKSKENK